MYVICNYSNRVCHEANIHGLKHSGDSDEEVEDSESEEEDESDSDQDSAGVEQDEETVCWRYILEQAVEELIDEDTHNNLTDASKFIQEPFLSQKLTEMLKEKAEATINIGEVLQNGAFYKELQDKISKLAEKKYTNAVDAAWKSKKHKLSKLALENFDIIEQYFEGRKT